MFAVLAPRKPRLLWTTKYEKHATLMLHRFLCAAHAPSIAVIAGLAAVSPVAVASSRNTDVPAPQRTAAPDRVGAREESAASDPLSTEMPPPNHPRVSPLSGPVAGDEASGFVQRSVGAVGLLSYPGRGPWLGGGGVQVRGSALLFGPLISARYVENHWLGYDSAGVSYSLNAQMGIGLRWELAKNHGPFVRAELRGEMRRSGGF